MKTNVGTVDRAVRILLGLALLAMFAIPVAAWHVGDAKKWQSAGLHRLDAHQGAPACLIYCACMQPEVIVNGYFELATLLRVLPKVPPGVAFLLMVLAGLAGVAALVRQLHSPSRPSRAASWRR